MNPFKFYVTNLYLHVTIKQFERETGNKSDVQKKYGCAIFSLFFFAFLVRGGFPLSRFSIKGKRGTVCSLNGSSQILDASVNRYSPF